MARVQGVLNSGRYANGAIVYSVPVRVLLNNSKNLDSRELEFNVLGLSAADVANFVRDQFKTRPETEIYAYGPRGGVEQRFVGWDTAIWHRMLAEREVASDGQGRLF